VALGLNVSPSDHGVNSSNHATGSTSVEWTINGVVVFSQPTIGVKLLQKHNALDTGGLSLTCRNIKLVPAVGTFSWMDLIHPDDKCDPIVKLDCKYFSPISDIFGNKHKLKSRIFLTKDTSQQMFGQGAELIIKSYKFDTTNATSVNTVVGRNNKSSGNVTITKIEPYPVKVEYGYQGAVADSALVESAVAESLQAMASDHMSLDLRSIVNQV